MNDTEYREALEAIYAQQLALLDEQNRLSHERAELFRAKLEHAERAALKRLNEYVPQDRLLTSEEAAAYLQYSVRWLNGATSGKSPRIKFTVLGGRKRFRKQWLDEAVERGEVKPRKVASP